MRRLTAVLMATLFAAGAGCTAAGSRAAAPTGPRHETGPAQPTGTPSDRSCPPTKSGTGRGSVAVDYVDFIQVDGRTYIANLSRQAGSVSRADLGRTVLVSRCAFSRLNDRTGQAPAETRDGDTGFLLPGTPVQKIRGWSVSCRLAAAHDGRLNVYLAYRDGDDVARPRPCALRRPGATS